MTVKKPDNFTLLRLYYTTVRL